MKFEEVNNKATDSLILSLETLTKEYNIVLNSYNQVQQELDSFANSQWTVNPYLNKNIQFTTGEIAYVSISGSVFLYSFLPQLNATISADQESASTAQTVVTNEQPVVAQAQQAYNNAYSKSIGGMFSKLFETFTTREPYSNFNSPFDQDLTNAANQTENAVTTLFSGGVSGVTNNITNTLQTAQNEVLSGIFGKSASSVESGLATAENAVGSAIDTTISGATNFLSGGDDKAIDNAFSSIGSSLSSLFGGGNASHTSQLLNQLNSDKVQLQMDQNALNAANNQVTIATNNYQDALAQLVKSGCPPISNVMQVNLPWLSQYNQPYNLIPTTPPLLTMGQFVYSNGQIGFNGSFGPNNNITQTAEGCNSLNSLLTPPPYDLIKIKDNSFVGTTAYTMQNSTIELCKASCYSTPKCSGATFNTQTNTCNLNTGSGNLQSSTGSIAIIPQITRYLLILSQLNFKLTDINDQIVNVIKKAQPDFVKYTDDNEIDDKLLKNRYTKLIEERIKIEKMIDDIGKTQNEENYESSFTNMTYFKYFLLIALAIIVFILLMNISIKNATIATNADNKVHLSLIIVIVIVLVIVFSAYLLKKYVSGTPV